MKASAVVISIVCWSGRILGLGLLVVWGTFFVEHLEWFLHPAKGLPPVWVWAAQLAHLTFLVGLAALWRWPVVGSVLTIVGSLSFFGGLAISQAAAGQRYLSLLALFAVTIIPALMALACSFRRGDGAGGNKRPVGGIE
jgi:hypothetical protein